ncbi:hypothetical protein HZ994_17760 [Akkermansiaceae bacterium]|nr:hypothetical protein HZ994_17760 [Akkermansiaceae bacterium]
MNRKGRSDLRCDIQEDEYGLIEGRRPRNVATWKSLVWIFGELPKVHVQPPPSPITTPQPKRKNPTRASTPKKTGKSLS